MIARRRDPQFEYHTENHTENHPNHPQFSDIVNPFAFAVVSGLKVYSEYRNCCQQHEIEMRRLQAQEAQRQAAESMRQEEQRYKTYILLLQILFTVIVWVVIIAAAHKSIESNHSGIIGIVYSIMSIWFPLDVLHWFGTFLLCIVLTMIIFRIENILKCIVEKIKSIIS